MRKRLFALLVLAAGVCAGARPALSDNFILGLPGDFSGERAEIEALISKAFVATKPGDTLSIYNAGERQRLSYLSIPQNPSYENQRLKQKTFAGELQAIRPLLERMGGAPEAPPSNIGLPQFLREIANSALPTFEGKQAEVLVVGSAKYYDDRERQFSMLDGYFPSDGHLLANDDQSPFGVANRQGSLAGVNVHLCSTDTDWIDDVHRQRVERFWSLYVRQMGGTLASFTPDLNVCAQRFVGKVNETSEQFEIDPQQTKAEMLRITRPSGEPETPEPAPAAPSGDRFMDPGLEIATEPPINIVGPAKIGIRWPCDACDIDLYARAGPGADFLYFANQLTAEGRHNKDWRQSPDTEQQYEYIDFTAPIDITKLDLYVHFYRGQKVGGVNGVVRLWFDGKIYETTFYIPAERGNQKAEKRPDRLRLGEQWVAIDVGKLALLDGQPKG